MEYEKRCVKFELYDNTYIDLLADVLEKMEMWRQVDSESNEACGFILGYQNKQTKNITISNITNPQEDDFRTRFFCRLQSIGHFKFLEKEKLNQNYYLGVWHSHPQRIPEPSWLDFQNWNDILEKDQTGSDCVIFIIIGTKAFRVWVGSYKTKEIVEVFESKIQNGVYIRGDENFEN